MCFSIAERLGHDVDVVMSWPMSRIDEWVAFFDIKADEQKKKA